MIAATWSTISRDGEAIATVPTADVMAWFHRNQSCSMDRALRYEGYSVQEVTE